MKKKRRKKWENDKCRREVGEERKNKESYEKEILKKERKFWYDDVRDRRREEPECRNFHEISHQWHDDDFEKLHEREEFEEERGRKLREDEKEKNRWVNFFSLFDIYINRF